MLGRLFAPSAITRLGLKPPSPAPGRKGLTLSTVVRNEARHIGEWGRFHRLVGVDRFVVYDNGSGDGTVAALEDAVGADRVTALPWDQKLQDARGGAELHNQVLAFAHALRNFGADSRWMAFTDVDEFIVPRHALTVPEVLQGLGDFGCLSLPWAMFGRGGQLDAPEAGTLPTYLKRNRDALATPRVLRFKCIVDPCRVTAAQVHEFEIEGQSEGINDQGKHAAHKDRSRAAFVSFDALQLNHYYTRSDAELRAKIARGSNRSVDAKAHEARVWRNVALIEGNTVEDRAALDLLARHGVSEL